MRLPLPRPRPLPLPLTLLAAATATIACLWPAGPAHACGGCFAATPPPGTPQGQGVRQTAERVLFVQDPASKTTRVWIEVRYSGPASDFAWVLPLPKVPTVGVGASWVFDRLDLATGPRFALQTAHNAENCDALATGGYADAGGGCGGDLMSTGYEVQGSSGQAGNGGGGAGAAIDVAGVEVVEHDSIGPYAYDVVQSADPQALALWLKVNGYAMPPAAQPVIAAHVGKGDVFLALRLRTGAQVEQIRPIALTMQDADVCVPLRLTSIAAVEDTSVIVYVAGPGRAVPKNALHVVPNLMRYAWIGGTPNYQQLLSAALDEGGGHAFTTEFSAAPVDVVVEADLSLVRRQVRYGGDNNGLYEPGPVFQAPKGPVDLAQRLGKVKTNREFVEALAKPWLVAVITPARAEVFEKHTKLATLMKQPDLVSFYAGCKTMGEMIPGKFLDLPCNGAALAADLLAAAKVEEGPEVQAMASAVLAQPRLTRLAMLLSPSEMDRDPVFAFHTGLPTIGAVRHAMVTDVCTAGGRQVDALRLTVPGLASWVMRTTQGPGEFLNTKDPRALAAPFAQRIDLMEEGVAPRTIDPSQVELVSQAIIGAQPGQPTLPASIQLLAGTPWHGGDDPVFQSEPSKGSGVGGGMPRNLHTMLMFLASLASLLLVRRWRSLR